VKRNVIFGVGDHFKLRTVPEARPSIKSVLQKMPKKSLNDLNQIEYLPSISNPNV
jgi:hypothetical protein